MYGANEMAIDGDLQTEVRYIRITDIDADGNLQNTDWKTAKKIDEKYSLDENDILFARSGATAGKAFIYKKEYGRAIFAGYMIRFRFDKTRVNPLFVFCYTLLSRYRSWVRTIQRPSGQPNINSREFKSFEIPLPPLDIQNHMVKVIQSAYTQKRQREQEADTLLSSIDDYVLAELGVEMPAVEETQKVFAINRNEVEGRLDPVFYRAAYLENQRQLRQAKWEAKTLKEISDRMVDGPFGSELKVEEYVEEGIPLIRVGDIKNGKLVESNFVFISPEKHQKLKRSEVNSGDIVLTKAGSIGNATILPDHIPIANITSHLAQIRLKAGISTEYVCTFLESKLGRLQIFRLGNKTTRPELNLSEVASILVGLPPLDIQNSIAQEAKKRRHEAEKLRQEAAKKWEAARTQFEEQLLSGEVS